MMSREFKFRAYHKGIMHENIYFDDDYCFKNLPSSHGTWEGWHAPIDDVRVSQFTGLRDKNGIEIFEGDILNLRTINYVIKYCSKEGRYELYDKVNDVYKKICSGTDSYLYNVVGNIYKNKDLINEQRY